MWKGVWGVITEWVGVLWGDEKSERKTKGLEMNGRQCDTVNAHCASEPYTQKWLIQCYVSLQLFKKASVTKGNKLQGLLWVSTLAPRTLWAT